MVYIISKNSITGRKPMQDREQELSRRIERGTINDRDIADIVDRGSIGLKKKLDEKVDREMKNKEHLQRIHGNVVDGRDTQGRLYKNISLNEKSFGL